MIAAAPNLLRYEAYRSVYAIVSRHVENEKLRQALSFHTLLVGGNPMKTSAIYALIHALERRGGVWFPKGGTIGSASGRERVCQSVEISVVDVSLNKTEKRQRTTTTSPRN